MIPTHSEVSNALHPVRQFSVLLQNRPGALLSLLKLMGDHKVEVLGLSVQDASDVTLVRMVVTDPETLETLFMERGIAHGTHEIIAVEMQEGPADMGHCLSALLGAELNIHFCYSLLCRPYDKTVLVLSVDDLEFAGKVLNSSGFHVLQQTDLSR